MTLVRFVSGKCLDADDGPGHRLADADSFAEKLLAQVIPY
jgi:hypothetical protein